MYFGVTVVAESLANVVGATGLSKQALSEAVGIAKTARVLD